MNNNLLAGGGSGTITNPLFNGKIYDGLVSYTQGGSGFFNLVLPKLVGLVLVFGSVAFFFIFVWGAISWILSGGDKAHVESARARITNSLIGFILMISVFAVAKLIETFFGIDILSIDIGPLIIQ
ncbi:MAG: hypothetical protein AAB778_01260 [Patescibacteria group bacterium]